MDHEVSWGDLCVEVTEARRVHGVAAEREDDHVPVSQPQNHRPFESSQYHVYKA